MRTALGMGMAESSRGRRERSPKQEYLKQCACGVRMSGGGDGLYRRGGASDSTNLEIIMGFDEQQLLVQLSHRNLINHNYYVSSFTSK